MSYCGGGWNELLDVLGGWVGGWVGGLTCRENVHLVPIQNRHQLLPHVLRAFHRPTLEEIFKAPRVAELGVLPAFVHGEKSEMISLDLDWWVGGWVGG